MVARGRRFLREGTGVPGENPSGQAGDDLTLPRTYDSGIEPGSHW